jgi:hypothetical protein
MAIAPLRRLRFFVWSIELDPSPSKRSPFPQAIAELALAAR